MKKVYKSRRYCLLIIVSVIIFINTLSVEATENKVKTLMDNMSLREKIAQMMMVDFRMWDMNLEDSQAAKDFVVMNEQVQSIVENYNFGAVIYFANNIQNTEQAFKLTLEMQEAATKNGGIPMLISVDQEGGSVYRLGSGTALPGNMALGAAGKESYAEHAGKIVGSELDAIGINMNLAPVVDVNNNANNPVIGLRSYGDDAKRVGELASAFIAGMNQHNVIGCAKHFPGHGDTDVDSHYGLPVVEKTKTVLQENELKPFGVAIENGIEMIMTAHILYPQLDDTKIYSEKTGKYEAVPATMSKVIISDLLKEEMNFDGIVITDAMRMEAVAKQWGPVQAVTNAINAGVDMICMPCVLYDLEDIDDLEAIIDGVETAVLEGKIEPSRIDDAVERILQVKNNRGILEYDEGNHTIEKANAVVGSAENRQMERKIAAAAVTVVKNEQDVLPVALTPESKVLMLCPNNNERAQLVMGWNRAKEEGIIPAGATMKYYLYSSASITSELKEMLDWADTIIVISEVSSSGKMAYRDWHSQGPYCITNYAKEQGKKSIIMSADKPYDVQLYPNADAVVAVYGCKGSTLDPTEAEDEAMVGTSSAYGPNIIAGVEVILGVFGAEGKLPVNIPQFDENTGTYTEQLAYSRGFGLNYESLVKDKVAKIEIADSRLIYDGTEKEPEIVVFSKNGQVLRKDNDYFVEYKNNINAGTAIVQVKGIGSYEGELTETYEIEKAESIIHVSLPADVIEIDETIKLQIERVQGNGKLSYQVADSRIISIDDNGKITGRIVGTGTIKILVQETNNYKETEETVVIKVDFGKPEVNLDNVEKTGKIKLSWDAVGGATKYEVYRATSKTGKYKKLLTTSKNSCINTSVKVGKRYYYKVRAMNKEKGLYSKYSTIKSCTCDLPSPQISLSNVATTGKIRISWRKVSNAKKYEVYCATSATGIYKRICTTSSLACTNTSAKAGKTYYYKVRAIHRIASANSAYSSIKSRTCDLRRPNVKITSFSGKIRLSWEKVSGAMAYKIYRATSKNGTYREIATTEDTKFTNSSLKKGKIYYYKVEAICQNSAGNSAKSKIVYKKVVK